MALSDDQKAMLRLLAQRDVGLEDIAALKGMSVEEVQAEVDAALGDAGHVEEPAKEPEPSVEPDPEPEPAEPAPERQPRPAEPPRRAAKPRASAGPPRKRPRVSVPPERRRFVAISAGALGVVAIVLGAIALFGDGSDSSPEGAGGATAGGQNVSAEDGKVTQAVLQAPEGGDASGRALFGRLGKDEVVLQVTAEGLEPTPEGESYTVWLYRSPKLALRVGSVKVQADEGELGARFPIPAELLAYIAGGAFKEIYVSQTSDAAYRREVAQAKKQDSLPRYSGETVLTGKITGPIVEAGQNAGGGNAGGGNG